MAKTFDVAQLSVDEAITVKLKDGKELRAKELTPEVVDALGLIEDKRAREGAKDEAQQRQHMRVLEDENASQEDWGKANEGLIDVVTRQGQRARTTSYEQLAAVFVDDAGKALTVKFLREQIPLPVARGIGDELTRQILGRQDTETGNAPESDGAPTPTASTA